MNVDETSVEGEADELSAPQLDYAFIADDATVSDNKLNARGASYTHLRVAALPTLHKLAIAGRIRVPENFGPVEVSLTFSSPPEVDGYSVEGLIQMEANDDVRPYRGRVGLVFASTLTPVLPVEGLYTVTIKLEGQVVRTLAFSVESGRASAT